MSSSKNDVDSSSKRVKSVTESRKKRDKNAHKPLLDTSSSCATNSVLLTNPTQTKDIKSDKRKMRNQGIQHYHPGTFFKLLAMMKYANLKDLRKQMKLMKSLYGEAAVLQSWSTQLNTHPSQGQKRLTAPSRSTAGMLKS